MTLRRWRRAHAKDLAEHEGISMNQLITTGLAEKVSALETQSFLEERARRGNRRKFENALSKVADREPEDEERL